MCTLVILRRPGHRWPLLVAANRDEMADRPWLPPGRHWRGQPDVRGGLDVPAGGTWLALGDTGVLAAVLNRINTLGPAPGRRSRGELPLLALRSANAREGAAAIAAVDPHAWRSFNMIVADAAEAFWIRATDGSGPDDRGAAVHVEVVPPGLSMITAYDRNDLRSPRTRRYLPRFEAAATPRPEAFDWRAWIELLACRDAEAAAGPGGAMTVVTATGFGTVSSSLLALPADGSPRWWFAAGRPGESRFETVAD